jgi:Ca2+-transporting ATPase
MAAGGIGLFLWQYDEIRPFLSDPVADPEFALRKAQTMAVTTVVLFQVFYLFQCRSLRVSVLRVDPFSNLTIYSGVLATVAMQVAFVHSELMNRLFNSEPLEPREWALSIAVATAVLPVVSLHKRSAAKAARVDRAEWPVT